MSFSEKKQNGDEHYHHGGSYSMAAHDVSPIREARTRIPIETLTAFSPSHLIKYGDHDASKRYHAAIIAQCTRGPDHFDCLFLSPPPEDLF